MKIKRDEEHEGDIENKGDEEHEGKLGFECCVKKRGRND